MELKKLWIIDFRLFFKRKGLIMFSKILKSPYIYLAILSVTLIFLFGRNNKPFNEDEYIEDYEIYNQILYQVEFYGIYLFGDPSKFFDSYYSESPYNEQESRKIMDKLISEKSDTTKLDLDRLTISIISDSLLEFNFSDIEKFQKHFHYPDTIEYFKPKCTKPIDIQKLNKPKYCLLIQDKDREKLFTIDSNRHFAIFDLSRIILNNRKDKGIFYIRESYLRLGAGFMLFIQKENGAWFIKKCIQLFTT